MGFINSDNMNSVVEAYYNNFDYVNNDEHQEYYKWEAFKHFEEKWDIEAENFAEMFKESMKLTSNLIDNSRVSPTNGIYKLAIRPELTETIRGLFKNLFSSDGGDLCLRQKRIEMFRDEINQLLDKYEPGKWKYTQEFRTVLFYLNMKYPSENYLFKATEAKEFMYCIEFEDDFGSGTNFSLSRYYRMCDKLLEKVKNTQKLVDAHNSRLTHKMLDNDDLHILVFDIIYCAIVYGFYNDIEIKKPIRKSNIVAQRNSRISELNEKLESIENELTTMVLEKSSFDNISVVGLRVKHRIQFVYRGEGTIVSQDENEIDVSFGNKSLKCVIPDAFFDGILLCDDEEVIDVFSELKKINQNIELLRSQKRQIIYELNKISAAQ